MKLRISLALIFAVIFSPLAHADAVGIATLYSGDASITRNRVSMPLVSGHEVENGDLLETHEDGRLQVSFKDGSVISLGSNSVLRIAIVQATGETSTRQVGLEMLKGFLRVFASKSSGESRFDVTTQHVVTAVRGTQFGFAVSPAKTQVMVFEGRVLVCRKFFLQNASLSLTAGDGATATGKTLSVKQRWTEQDAALIPQLTPISEANALPKNTTLIDYTFPTCTGGNENLSGGRPGARKKGTDSRNPTGGSIGADSNKPDPIPQ